MYFSREYYQDEEREGFLIESMVKRAWAVQMEILKVIDDICKKHDIKYFAFWGTLLGAIRHKGFVPWDDDMDIAMKREDYDRFIEIAPSEVPKDYKVLSIYTEPEWNVATSRLVNGTAVNLNDVYLLKNHGCPYASGVDIFPYDYLPTDQKKLDKLDYDLNFVAVARDYSRDRDEQIKKKKYCDKKTEKRLNELLNELEKKYGFKFSKDNNLDNQLLCLYDQVSASYGSDSDYYMTCHVERLKRKGNGGDFKLPAFFLDDCIEYPFESMQIRVPRLYELCLSRCYGMNFMTPVKGGSAHDYPFFAFQEERLKELGWYEKMIETVNRVTDVEVLLAKSEAEKAANAALEAGEDETAHTEALNSLQGIDTDEAIKRINAAKAEGKKIMMFCISSMDFFEREEDCIKKLKDTMDFFDAQKEKVKMILVEDVIVPEILSLKGEDVLNEYDKIVTEYENRNDSVYITYNQVGDIADLCDAYYGSGNECIKPFQNSKKPVMIQNPDILNYA